MSPEKENNNGIGRVTEPLSGHFEFKNNKIEGELAMFFVCFGGKRSGENRKIGARIKPT